MDPPPPCPSPARTIPQQHLHHLETFKSYKFLDLVPDLLNQDLWCGAQPSAFNNQLQVILMHNEV